MQLYLVRGGRSRIDILLTDPRRFRIVMSINVKMNVRVSFGKNTMSLLDRIVNVIDRLLSIVNSWQRLLVLAALIALGFSAVLLYRIAENDQVTAEVGAPQIERVSGLCYQQRVRSDRRIVAIQFPIPDDLAALGVKQNLVALVFQGKIDQERFDRLCKGLLNEISELRIEQFYGNPELQKKMQQFYRDLDVSPTDAKPIKKSDVEADKVNAK